MENEQDVIPDGDSTSTPTGSIVCHCVATRLSLLWDYKSISGRASKLILKARRKNVGGRALNASWHADNANILGIPESPVISRLIRRKFSNALEKQIMKPTRLIVKRPTVRGKATVEAHVGGGNRGSDQHQFKSINVNADNDLWATTLSDSNDDGATKNADLTAPTGHLKHHHLEVHTSRRKYVGC